MNRGLFSCGTGDVPDTASGIGSGAFRSLAHSQCMCCYTKRRLPDAASGGGSGGFLWNMHPDAVCGGNGTGGGTKIDIGGNGNGGVEVREVCTLQCM